MAKKYSVILCMLILSFISVAYGTKDRYSHDIQKVAGKTLRVEKVYDGDTIAVFNNGHFEKVRLIGIDAPEMDQKPWGKKAKKCIESFIADADSRISLEYDMERRDKYGRILAYLWTQDRKMINEEMLKKGCAVLFTIPPNVKYVSRFRAAQKKAQNHKTGIWGENGLRERPYDYRKEHPRR